MTEESGLTRFGFTKEEGEEFNKRYGELLDSMPKVSQNDGVIFFDWEAAQLSKVFQHFRSTDPDVCAVLAHMMSFIDDVGRGAH